MEDNELEDGYVEGEDVDCQPPVEDTQEVYRPRERVIRPVPEVGSLEEELASEAWMDAARDEEERGER